MDVEHPMIIATWRGRVAWLDLPTDDGRMLKLGTNQLAHFSRMPVPLFALAPGSPRASIGSATRVRVDAGALYATGQLDFTDLLDALPDWKQHFPNSAGPGVPAWPYLPCGVTVLDHEITYEPRSGGSPGPTIAGDWSLSDITIYPPGTATAWPGIGIELVDLTGDGS
jgi:hypothetical protein